MALKFELAKSLGKLKIKGAFKDKRERKVRIKSIRKKKFCLMFKKIPFL